MIQRRLIRSGFSIRGIRIIFTSLIWLLTLVGPFAVAAEQGLASASSSQSDFSPAGPIDGDRFSFAANHAWKGNAGEANWWWQIQFPEPRRLGAILQIQGDHEFLFQNVPRSYQWQGSLDGRAWRDLEGTRIEHDQRLYRVHRLRTGETVRFLRLQINAVDGKFPTLREVEFYSDPRARIVFPDWILAVNTTHDPQLHHGKDFIPLAKSCSGWGSLQAQEVWLGSFDEAFCKVEPHPLCAFLSGGFKDWCQIDREPWRGTQEVLRRGDLPLWASCGGAQGLAILATVGVDKPWDCPHCRDPQNPKVPIYTHIGHTAERPCGDYSGCIFERGPHAVRQLTRDKVFQGLPDEFQVVESHCGQIEWPPPGWELIATAGPGTLTKTQCLKVKDRLIYAAQFHIEMSGTPETSQRIMSNFLTLARQWDSNHALGNPNPVSPRPRQAQTRAVSD
jgi:hypothetical protein